MTAAPRNRLACGVDHPPRRSPDPTAFPSDAGAAPRVASTTTRSSTAEGAIGGASASPRSSTDARESSPLPTPTAPPPSRATAPSEDAEEASSIATKVPATATTRAAAMAMLFFMTQVPLQTKPIPLLPAGAASVSPMSASDHVRRSP